MVCPARAGASAVNAAWALAALGAGYMIFLFVESFLLRRARKRLRHVVHVNGTRGKSSVTRLIDAGLRAGGYRVMSKTTGTLPLLLNLEGAQEPVRRRFHTADIREQAALLRRAAREGAQVLVLECMAVSPELQYASEHKMLHADVGVITNARRDHGDQMGDSREEVLSALMNTVPENGTVYTADQAIYPSLAVRAQALHSHAVLAQTQGITDAHPDNAAVALAVCQALGVERETALKGFARVQPDPYAERLIEKDGCLILDALSANDADSTLQMLAAARERAGWDKPLSMLICCRSDRPARTEEMLRLSRIICPSTVYLLGSGRAYLARALPRALPKARVLSFKRAQDVPLPRGGLLLCAGNIKGEGMKFSDAVREGGHAG